MQGTPPIPMPCPPPPPPSIANWSRRFFPCLFLLRSFIEHTTQHNCWSFMIIPDCNAASCTVAPQVWRYIACPWRGCSGCEGNTVHLCLRALWATQATIHPSPVLLQPDITRKFWWESKKSSEAVCNSKGSGIRHSSIANKGLGRDFTSRRSP